MKHLSDETINEYLDQALAPTLRPGVEAHLTACPICASRMAALRALFAELDSLPDISSQLDFAPAVLEQIAKPTGDVPRLVQWLAGAQVLAMLVAGILAWPLVTASLPQVPSYLPHLERFAAFLSAISATRLDLANSLRLPSLAIPVIDLPSATLIYSAIGLSLLWLLGNGLFLLPRPRRKS